MSKNDNDKLNIKNIAYTIFSNWNNIYWWKRVAFRKLFSLYFKKIIGNKGIYVMEEDWDNLIILDACRYDAFNKIIKKEADYRTSRGSNTIEFLKENFSKKQYNDTVVITANPHLNKYKKNFFKMIPVWKQGWNEKFQTVMPDTMVDYSIKAYKKYSKKKLIIWFMQPHYPFIGDPEFCNYGNKRAREIAENRNITVELITPWIDADKGIIDIQKVWRAYIKNIELVIPYAFKLANILQGKTVITSDHGNTFKSLSFPPIKVVGHPMGIYISELIQVPWLEIENGKRREIVMDASNEEMILKKRISQIKNLTGPR